MTRVVHKPGESFESLLKHFRKRVTRDRVLSEARKHRYSFSNSEKWRIVLRKAVRRERRRRRRQQRVYVG